MMPSPSSARRRKWTGGGGIEISKEGGEALGWEEGVEEVLCRIATARDLDSVTAGSTTLTPSAMAVTLGRRRRCSGQWHLRKTDGGTQTGGRGGTIWVLSMERRDRAREDAWWLERGGGGLSLRMGGDRSRRGSTTRMSEVRCGRWRWGWSIVRLWTVRRALSFIAAALLRNSEYVLVCQNILYHW
jgi:hypothetical protein